MNFWTSATYLGFDFSIEDSFWNAVESRNVELLVVNDMKLVDVVRSVGVTGRGVSSHIPHLGNYKSSAFAHSPIVTGAPPP